MIIFPLMVKQPTIKAAFRVAKISLAWQDSPLTKP
jgi:hypothetical protein